MKENELKKNKTFAAIGGRRRYLEPLARHTTFKIGGPAEVWVVPENEENLSKLARFSRREKIPLVVMGAGSNVLVSDDGVRGIVVRLSSPAFCSLRVSGTNVTAGAGVKISCFLRAAAESGLEGAEFLAGIPGTVGGALAVNAGAKDINNGRRRSIGDIVTRIKVMDKNGEVRRIGPEKAGFFYRNSDLDDFIVMSACFRLRKGDSQEIKRSIRRLIRERRKRQELSRPSAGCVFRNPAGQTVTSARLIESARLPGRCVGGAQVSRRHANFIVNRGGATAADVTKLMSTIREEVIKKCGIALEPEIMLMGEFYP